MKQWKEQMLAELSIWRGFRIGQWKDAKYRHVYLLLFWPLYGIAFAAVELWEDRDWTAVYWPGVDDMIPFCEYFVIPYIFWFVFLGGMVAFTLLFDREAFRKMMYFIIITYTVTIIIYLIWPTEQHLRPNIATFGRDNFLTRFMQGFYDYDTHTNVCPSIHVLGSVAVLFGSWHCKYFRRSVSWQIFFWVWTVLISISTVFLKQHSAIDIPTALALSVIAYPFAFRADTIFKIKKRIPLPAADVSDKEEQALFK